MSKAVIFLYSVSETLYDRSRKSYQDIIFCTEIITKGVLVILLLIILVINL